MKIDLHTIGRKMVKKTKNVALVQKLLKVVHKKPEYVQPGRNIFPKKHLLGCF